MEGYYSLAHHLDCSYNQGGNEVVMTCQVDYAIGVWVHT